jgi:hypothetical protein
MEEFCDELGFDIDQFFDLSGPQNISSDILFEEKSQIHQI